MKKLWLLVFCLLIFCACGTVPKDPPLEQSNSVVVKTTDDALPPDLQASVDTAYVLGDSYVGIGAGEGPDTLTARKQALAAAKNKVLLLAKKTEVAFNGTTIVGSYFVANKNKAGFIYYIIIKIKHTNFKS